MESIWTTSADLPEFPVLEEEIHTDVLIIGGGLCGILCAYFLQQAGVDYCLLEKNRICSGITRNTTAKITAQHGLIYGELMQKEGAGAARLYLKANLMAVEAYRRLGSRIACDLEEKNAYVYARADRSLLEWEMAALERIGGKAKFVERVKLPFRTEGAVCFPRQLQFHPLKFAGRLAEGLRIYEQSGVRSMTEHLALTEKGAVRAEKMIVATHFPFINTRGSYYMKLYQERAYVTAWRNAPDVDGMYVDAAGSGLSFRNQKKILLVGGGSHRTGKTIAKSRRQRGTTAGSAARPGRGEWGLTRLKLEAASCLPQAEFVGAWAAQDCMSLDKMPYIGRYSSSTPDLYVGCGYNKWGMTSAMVSAMILSDLVQEKENEFAELFTPERNMLKPQLAVNALEAVRGILRPVPGKRCSHMGCVLKWNPEEKAWECPCHGSRFGREGRLLDNPARTGLRRLI